MSEYKFERLNDSNLKDLQFLYGCAFNEIASLDFLQKKYDTSFTGIKHVGFIAYHSVTNLPAAYYGVFPIKLELKKETLIAAQSGDTMTHSDHRGKGLFITLAKMTYDLARELNVEFIFGFPNDNSYPGFVKKLNWKHYSNINNYKIKASAIPLDKLAKKFKFFKPFYGLILPISEQIKIRHQFSNSVTQQNESCGGVRHDGDFYRYKNYYPSFVIKFGGIKCWLKIDGRLWVGDIEICDEKKFNEVVEEIILFAKRKMCATVQFSVFENSLYDKWLKKRAAVNSTLAVGCLNLSMKYDPEQFAYQAVDFDTY